MVDLHMHSTYSDGTFTPRQLIAKAAELNLTAVALTDHNGVGGISEFLDSADVCGVRAVAGAEFSTEFDGSELHIVALFIDRCRIKTVSALMESVLREKHRCYERLISRINDAYGLSLSLADIEKNSNGPINRVHIARKLMEIGLISSVKEGFDTVLSAERGLYVPSRRIDALDMIKTINEMRAVSVLAHPYLSLDEDGLNRFLPQAVDAGLAAMECFYSTFTPLQTERALAEAKKYGLLPSGGSDFHGDNKPHISLGTGMGTLSVPDEVYFALLNKKHSLMHEK